jgi:hypothetical protein
MPAPFQRRFLIPANAGALPAPVSYSGQRRRPSGAGFFICAVIQPILTFVWKRNRRGRFQVGCDEALARDEQIGNAAILAPTSGADGAQRLDDVGTVIAYA